MPAKSSIASIKQRKGIVRIGTSNIVLPGTKLSFPAAFQQKSRLNYYSSLFNTLEINSSFYKVPMAATFGKWAQDVPENFRFTVKLSREITHAKKLEFGLDKVDVFLNSADRMGDKKGCLLIQFPGSIGFEYFSRVEALLERLQQQDPRNQWQKAIEFRQQSWYVSETFELLDEYGASMVLHDIPKGKNNRVNKAARFVYIRYHGPAGDYKGSYSDDFLRVQSEMIKEWLNAGRDVYAYFNNTIGNAFENAMTLKRMACG